MKSSLFEAKIANRLTYNILGIVIILCGIFTHRMTEFHMIFMTVYYIVSAILMSFFAKRRHEHYRLIYIIETGMFLFLSIGLCYVLRQRRVIYVCFIIQGVLSIYYMSRLYMLVQIVIQLISYSMVTYMPMPMLNGSIGRSEYIAGFAGIIISGWLAYNLVIGINNKTLRIKDQERSNEELLRIVEVKCDEARNNANAKSVFLANMSHEIRTPLNAILGMNEMIKKEHVNPDILEYSDNIETQCNLLLSKINDIFDVSKLDVANGHMDEGDYSVENLIYDLKNLISPKMQYKNLEFRIDIDPTTPAVLRGDEARIRQIVMNILNNAVQYTGEGYVTLSLKYIRSEVKDINLIFSVEDTGCGISKENIDKIFLPFSSVDDNGKHHGIGMGLALVKEFVALLHGSIDVKSEPDKGTCFTVEFPQKIVKDEPIGDIFNQASQKNLSVPKGLRLLFVDDVAINLAVFENMLSGADSIVDLAGSGKEAIELCKNNRYDMIFMDHMMPEMDGVETMENIKKLENFDGSTPFIIVTANAVRGVREEYMQLGFTDYIAKPVDKDRFLSIIREYGGEDRIPETVTTAVDLSSIKTLDFQTGLAYCNYDEALYLDVLNEFVTSADCKNIDHIYEAEEWISYENVMHSLKSQTGAIGADLLSRHIKSLEYAARVEDIDYIISHHEGVMLEYQDMLNSIGNAIRDIQIKNEDFEKNNNDDKHLVYIVDDDPINNRIAKRILDGVYNVRTFVNGEDLLKLIKDGGDNDTGVPSLLLMNTKFHNMTGFDLVDRIKEYPAWIKVPVIFMAADEDNDIEVRGFRRGASDFVKKPFVPSVMLERVSRILEYYRLKDYLENEVDRKSEKVKQLSLQVMQTLAMTIDAKDRYTNGHSTRVAKYSKMLASRMGYTGEELTNIYFMALLHDIGKIGVPDTIINKSGKLTDEEFAMIKEHPVIGHGILTSITEIPDIEYGARWHHERIDGRGYPDGLKGDEIPIYARIIAVADSYDAMTSKRSYRDVLPQEQVLNEIIKGRNTQFDPHIADIMIDIIEEDKTYKLREH